MKHPEKLKEDAIVEALFHIRFSAPPDVPEEVVLGWLIDCCFWKGWELRRLPSSDIPAPIRRTEEHLKFQPSVELRDDKAKRLVKVGSNVLSLHFTGKYPGWPLVEPQLRQTVDALFDRIDNVKVSRLGLRYINAFEKNRHRIASAYDLDISIQLDNQQLRSPLSLNFMEKPRENFVVMTRIASKEFVQGNLPPDMTAVADIDVFTDTGFTATDSTIATRWLTDAHRFEKDAFFALLPNEVIKDLQE